MYRFHFLSRSQGYNIHTYILKKIRKNQIHKKDATENFTPTSVQLKISGYYTQKKWSTDRIPGVWFSIPNNQTITSIISGIWVFNGDKTLELFICGKQLYKRLK